MADFEAIRNCNDTIEKLDAALTELHASLTQWFLVDASRPDFSSQRIFRRPWLRDEHYPDRLRIDRSTTALDFGQFDQSSAVILWTEGEEDLKESDYQTVAAILKRSELCLRLHKNDREELLIASLEGDWRPLMAARPSLLKVLTLEVSGMNCVRFETTVPFRVPVDSARQRDQVSFKLLHSGPEFAEKMPRFELRTAADCLGKGTLVIDVDVATSGDRLAVRVENFAAPVQVLCLSSKVERGRRARFSPRQRVRLHLLFDRTTLDQEAWPRALGAVTGGDEGLLEDNEPSPWKEEAGNGRVSPRHWNRLLRQELASALAGAVGELHRYVQLELWWFADAPRGDIHPLAVLPSSRSAFGRSGQVHMKNLETELQGSSFDYATGIDLYDAVDELLDAVVKAIELHGGQTRHAVLIAGDSPPPPADEQDPIWQQVVDRPPATSARRSSLFQNALSRLAELEVPVGWLFVRHVNPPSSSREGRLARDVREHFPVYQNLRENVLSALERYPHLEVQATQGTETLPDFLRTLLRRMAAKPVETSELRIGAVP